LTTHQGKTIDWKLYPDLMLPHEVAADIVLPRQVIITREREAFIQSQRRNYQQETARNTLARTSILGMLTLTMGERSAREYVTAKENDESA